MIGINIGYMDTHFSIHIEVKKKKNIEKKLVLFNCDRNFEEALKPVYSVTPPRRSAKRFKREEHSTPRVPPRIHLQPIVSSHQLIQIHRSISPKSQIIEKKPRSLKFFQQNPQNRFLPKYRYKKFTSSLFKLINSSKFKSQKSNEETIASNSLNLSENRNKRVLFD
jgi:hypothetical protein